MPTIFADKAFQNHYKDWTKEITKGETELTTETVFGDMMNYLSMKKNDEKKRPFSSKELKGLEIFTKFTALFFENHPISEEQAQQLNRALSDQLTHLRPKKHYFNIGQYVDDRTLILKAYDKQEDFANLLIAAETFTSEDSKAATSALLGLDNKIKSTQEEFKKTLKLETQQKQRRRRNKIIGALILSGAIGAIIAGVILTFVLGIPAILLGVLIIALAGGGASGGFLGGSFDRNSHTNTTTSKDIQRLIALRHLAEGEKFDEFINDIDSAKLSSIFGDNNKIIPFFELFKAELETKKINEKLVKVEQENRFQGKKKLHELNALNQSLEKQLNKIETLRDLLELPSSGEENNSSI